jgi:two-component system sensor histidine kinase HydH
MTQPLLKSRTARWGLLLSALLLGITLVGLSALGFRASHRDAESAALELAESLGRAVRVALFTHEWPPDSETLAELVADHEDLGLRYLALVGRKGKIVAEAGVTEFPIERSQLKPGRRLITIGNSKRIAFPAKQRPRDRRGMHRDAGELFDGHRLDDPPAPDGRGRMPGDKLRVVIDFEPIFSRKIISRAGLHLALSLLAALLLTGATLAFWRLSQRAVKAESALIDQRRLASLGEMSAVLAHEIRNPLGSLKGHAQLLRETMEPGSAEHGKADRVVEEAQKLEKLSTDLLDFIRSNQIELRDTDPSALFERAAGAVEEGEHGDSATIRLELSEAPETWLLDPDRLEQVLVNLLRNAVQASSPEMDVVGRAYVEADQLTFEVADFGAGIAEGDEQSLFEPFHTKRAKGVGLGLSVAKRIVEAHGGTITAGNRTEGGAVFKVTLPMNRTA